MLINSQLVKDHFGQYYKIQISRDKSAPYAIKAEQFSNNIQAAQFINNLKAPISFWSKIYNSEALVVQPVKNQYQLINALAELFSIGKIKAFKMDATALSESSPEKRTVKDKNKNTHTFTSATSLLISKPREVKTFSDKTEAKKYLKELSPDRVELQNVAKELDLPVTDADDELAGLIADGLAAGTIVVIVDRYSAPPASASDSDTSLHEEKDASYGPESSAAIVATQTDEEIICELTKFTAKCSHNRSVDMTDDSAGIILLEVVASETYEKDFEKITATIKGNALCGEHVESSSSISPEPVSTKKSSASNIYTLSCDKFTSPLQNIWLPSVKPKSYKIYPNAHQTFSPSAIAIDVYPKIKWNGELSYSFGGKESKRADNKNEHKNTTSKYTGKLELEYDGEKRDLAADYNDSIDQILTKLNWITKKVDKVLDYFDGGASMTLTVGWPNIKITYATELKEDEGSRAVINDYKLTLGASPLIEIKGSVDFFPVLMKSLPATHGIYKVLEQVKKGIGNEKGIAHLEGEIKLELSVGSGLHVNFVSSGTNGQENNNNKVESKIDIQFQLEGSITAKGHAWVIKFEKSYKVGIKSGFVGKVIVDKDDEGFYWYSRFLFNGLVIYFTKYDKLEKEVSNSSRKSKKFGVIDSLTTQSTKEWVCIKPDADEEAPYETQRLEGQAELDASDKHYLIRF
ncbi:MAG: hypothetical protein DIZ80_06855 [endosymbiont of Galathealinum brachiosum]|uniref:Uncharacterized protein n=1 Tax=endosymbiont of Galathealinum brachiosum TaxID=2200906 RepID=A0A370DG01_9GAMM|nr:MAG: hypothetical protein DIZ80_06855 [endosymbiont of Galathealinum brachiosum]